MKFVDPTKPDRKSGGMGHPQICWTLAGEEQALFFHCAESWWHVATMSTYGEEVIMRAIVKKWGNSASVRIPVAVMQAAHLNLNDAVDVRAESGRIIIELVRRKDYDLAELLEKITRKNVHQEVEFGRPAGKETCPSGSGLRATTMRRGGKV
jgi:antitoxin MazE